MTQVQPKTQNLRGALARLIEEKALFQGEFRSPSGGRSDYYIDMAMIFTEPTGLELVINLTLNELAKLPVDKIASPSVEADPIVAVVGMHAKLGSLFIHNGEPIYAYEKLENLIGEGKRVVIIADATFGGHTVLAAAGALRSAHANIEAAITLVDLQKGAQEFLRQNGIQLIPLIEWKDLTIPGKRQQS